MNETVLLPMISFNWPWIPSVTFMFPWTLYSSFDVLEKGGSTSGHLKMSPWLPSNASIDPTLRTTGLNRYKNRIQWNSDYPITDYLNTFGPAENKKQEFTTANFYMKKIIHNSRVCNSLILNGNSNARETINIL
ncbi:hypothetical protein T09_3162 [Trichinella sp. T9]|nr:hypothetical protein T09_3162 [Trichinella sp. T9]